MAKVVGKIALGAGLIVASIFVPGAFLATWYSSALFGIGLSTSLGGIAQAISKPQSGTKLNNPQGRTNTIRQAAASKAIIYGFTRVGGVLTFANFAGLRNSPTDQNQLVITVAGHGISSWEGIRFDEKVPGIDLGTGLGIGEWFGKAYVELKGGYDGDEAFPSLPNDSLQLWTTAHRQRGCAAAYLRLNYSESLYPNGVPNVSFLVKGKPVFDPRASSPITITGATHATPIVIHAPGHGLTGGSFVRITGVNADNQKQPNGTWGIDSVDGDHFSLQGSDGTQDYVSGGQVFPISWSNNAALVIADYLMDPWIGNMGVAYSKIKSSVLIASANICDEAVTTSSSPLATENRYTINGTFETSEQAGTILAQMANAMAGHVAYIGGEWHIIAGAFRLPVMEITDSIIVGPMQVQSKRSRRDLINGVKGTFASVGQNFIETDFPAITDDSYLAEDGGVRAWKDIFLPFTITGETAQRLSKIELQRNRRQIGIQMICSMSAYELQPGDVVEVTHSHYGWAAETFEVNECGLQQNDDGALVVALKLSQTDVDVYGFAVDDYGNPIEPDDLDKLLLPRKEPFGWSPAAKFNSQSIIATLKPVTDASFNIAQSTSAAADGSMVTQLKMSGKLPVNVVSQVIRHPRASLIATTASTGGFIRGGETYKIAACGHDDISDGVSGGRYTLLSDLGEVAVPVGTDTNTVTLLGLRWDPATAGWVLYFGEDDLRLSKQVEYVGSVPSQVVLAGPDAQPTSITFTGFDNTGGNAGLFPEGYYVHYVGAPDPRSQLFKLRIKRARHLGIWGGEVVSVSGDDTAIAVAPDFTTDALAGRFMSLIGRPDASLDLVDDAGMPLIDVLIESNTGTVITAEALQAAVSPLDVVVIRLKVTAVGSDSSGNYIEDALIGEGGEAWIDHAEKGNILVFISATAKGTRAVIADNIGTRIYIEGEWDETPDSSSIFVVLEPAWLVDVATNEFQVERMNQFVSLLLDIPNIDKSQLWIEIATSSHDGHEPEWFRNPYREIYIFGQPGSFGELGPIQIAYAI